MLSMDLIKQTLKTKYQFFISSFMVTLFIIVFFNMNRFAYEASKQPVYIIMVGALVLYSAICPLVLFDNISNKNADHLQSMPISRKKYFLVIYALGLIFGLFLAMTFEIFTILPTFKTGVFFDLTGKMIVIYFMYYALFTLCYWICGNWVFYLSMCLLFMFGPIVLYICYIDLMDYFIYGFYMENIPQRILEVLLPVSGVYHTTAKVFPVLTVAFGLVCFILNLFAVKKRPYELKGRSVLFQPLEWVIKGFGFIVVFPCLFLFTRFNFEPSKVEVMSFLLCAIICAYLIELLTKQNIKVFYSIKYGALFGIVMIGFFTFASGRIENYIPENPKSVTVMANNGYKYTPNPIEDKASIEVVKELHQDLVSHHKLNIYQCIYLTYELQNGMVVSRQYPYSSFDQIKPYLKNKDIYQSVFFPEYNVLDFLKEEGTTLYFYKSEEPVSFETEIEKQILMKNMEKKLNDYYLSQDFSKVADGYYYSIRVEVYRGDIEIYGDYISALLDDVIIK